MMTSTYGRKQMDLFDFLNVYCGFCGSCPEPCPRRQPCSRPQPYPCPQPCPCPPPCPPPNFCPPPKPQKPCYAEPYRPRRFLYADCPDCPPPKPCPKKPDPCCDFPCDCFPYPCPCDEPQAFPPVFPPTLPRCVPDGCDCPFARPEDCREFCFRFRVVRR